jgi:glycogen debranching enzyme
MADVFEGMGDPERAARLRVQSEALKRRFNEAFWIEEEGFYAMALDGEKKPVLTVGSNPAHGLYCGIIDREHAEQVGRRLLQPDMFSGWGVRTMSKGAVAYNPMSYHNGTIWPHDNALIAAGLKRYGLHKQTNRIGVNWGKLALRTLAFELPDGAAARSTSVTLAGRPIDAQAQQDGRRVMITFKERLVVQEGEAIEVEMKAD